jgi:hypothetical protein
VTATSALTARAREVRARAAVRNWEYRQRERAKGVWVRLARLLANSESAWEIPCKAAAALEQQGYPRAPVGRELSPELTILVVPAECIVRIAGVRNLEVRVSAELLAAPCIALVPFGDGQAPSPEAGSGAEG